MNINSTECGLVWEDDYRDQGNHCNYLEKNYQLVDHRNDENYISWEKCLSEYQKLIEKAKINDLFMQKY